MDAEQILDRDSAQQCRLLARLRAMVARAMPWRYYRGGYPEEPPMVPNPDVPVRSKISFQLPVTIYLSEEEQILRRYAKRIHIQRDGYYSELRRVPWFPDASLDEEGPYYNTELVSTPRWAAVAYPGEGYEGNPWLKGTGRTPRVAYLDRVNKLMADERLPEHTREAVRKLVVHKWARARKPPQVRITEANKTRSAEGLRPLSPEQQVQWFGWGESSK